MKKLWIPLLAVLLCIITVKVSGQKKLEVLFLGNSYTYVNDLPSLVRHIAHSKGDSLFTDENNPGGYTLQGHSTNVTSLSKINSRPWDYVVLQEQSQRPAFPPAQVAVEVYPFADSLNKYIKKNDSCSQTVFFMTWGRKNGDASNCAFYPPICTYEGMQASLRQSYLHMGQVHNALVAPVGVAWKRVRNQGDSIELYNPDESHPSLAGSYLAACTFYAVLFQKSPLGGYIPAGLNPYTAQHLQQYAHQVVFDSLSVWNLDTTTAKANFSTQLNQNVITITNNSVNASAYFWDFGDGQSQWGAVTGHSYASVGDYTLKLVAFKGCETDTMSQIIHVSVVGIDDSDFISLNPGLYPLPATDHLFVDIKEKGSNIPYSIYNALGNEVLSGTTGLEDRLDISALACGMYFIRMTSGRIIYSGKFQVIR